MRGISKIIEVILILIITVSLIGFSYKWLFEYSSKTQSSLEKNLPQSGGCLKIESIDTVNKKIAIRNCGESDLSNFVVFMDSSPIAYYSGKLSSGSITQISYTQSISPGDHDIVVSSDNAESSKITFSTNVISLSYYNSIKQSLIFNAIVKIKSLLKFKIVQNFVFNSFASATKTTSFSCGNAVLCLKFDEGSGKFANDSSSYKNNGTLGGFSCNPGSGFCPSWGIGTPTCWYGNCSNFDGAGDYINVSDSSSLHFGNITIIAWIYPRSFGQSNYGRITDKSNSFMFYVYNNTGEESLNFYFYNSTGTSSQSIASSHSIQLNKWQHVAVTYNGTHAVFYVNGTAQTPDLTSARGPIRTNTNGLYIGNSSSSGRAFDGIIDELRIWNRTLSQSEIQAEMNHNS